MKKMMAKNKKMNDNRRCHLDPLRFDGMEHEKSTKQNKRLLG